MNAFELLRSHQAANCAVHDGHGPLELCNLTQGNKKFIELRCALFDLSQHVTGRVIRNKKKYFVVRVEKKAGWVFDRESTVHEYYWGRNGNVRPAGPRCNMCGIWGEEIFEDFEGEMLCQSCLDFKAENEADPWYSSSEDWDLFHELNLLDDSEDELYDDDEGVS